MGGCGKVSFFIFPLQCSFLPFGVSISSFRKVKASVFSCMAHEAGMQSLAQHLSLWRDLLGGKRALVRIFSCLRFQIAHGERMVTARRRCFTNISFFSKRDFLSCFDRLDFLSSIGFWTHANALEMSQVYQSKLCIAGSSIKTCTHPCTDLDVHVCVHTEI